MMDFRSGEYPCEVFRTDRVSQIDGKWYFKTREKTQEGPYASRDDALLAINDYIRRMTSAQP